MFWSHTPRQPWQTEQYYASQRAILRPNTFARLHENTWVTAESAFLTPDLWDNCIDPTHGPLAPSRTSEEIVGVDLGVKHDNMAVVRLRWDGSRLLLAGYRLWKPAPNEPLNLEATVEKYLLEIHAANSLRCVLADPWQAYGSIQRLKGAGVPIEEFPQTVGNTTRMGQALYDLLKRRELVLFADEELRQQALNCIAIETPNGFRIAKDKASKKIDAIVALSMACVAAQREQGRPRFDISCAQVPTEELREALSAEGTAAILRTTARTGTWFPGDSSY
jgi:phage terminase large subunit-like protein